jgi:hypothetical protein
VEHDAAYYEGGSYRDRLKADSTLMACVAAAGRPYMAMVMFLGVRFFGSSFWPTQLRWGRRHPYSHAFRRRRCA